MLNLYDADGKIQFDKDREAAHQYFRSTSTRTRCSSTISRREARLPDQGELLRARGSRPVLAQLRQDAAGPRLRQEVPVPDVPRRVQVLHLLHAEDVRREALPRAVRGPRRHGGAHAGRRRHRAGREARRRDHRRPVPAGHPDVPQLGQEAARRASELLPAAHRGQHGVHRALHQLRAAAVQARRRSCVAAHQHSRARRTRSRTSRTRARASSRS